MGEISNGGYCIPEARLDIFLQRYIEMSLYQKNILCSMGYQWEMLRVEHFDIGLSMDTCFHDESLRSSSLFTDF